MEGEFTKKPLRIQMYPDTWNQGLRNTFNVISALLHFNFFQNSLNAGLRIGFRVRVRVSGLFTEKNFQGTQLNLTTGSCYTTLFG